MDCPPMKQDQALRFYFKDLLEGIDLRTESQRLDKVQFARERLTKQPKALPAPPVAPLTGIRKPSRTLRGFIQGPQAGCGARGLPPSVENAR